MLQKDDIIKTTEVFNSTAKKKIIVQEGKICFILNGKTACIKITKGRNKRINEFYNLSDLEKVEQKPQKINYGIKI